MIVHKVQSVFLLYGRLYPKNAVISHQVCNNIEIYLEFYETDRQKITSDSLSVKMENLLLIEIPPGD